MSASKEFFFDCYNAGLVPISENRSWDRLDDIESQLQLDWIDYRENSFQDNKGYYFAIDGISVISAMRLRDMGVSIPEIDDFLSLVDSIVGRARKEVA